MVTEQEVLLQGGIMLENCDRSIRSLGEKGEGMGAIMHEDL